MIESLTLLVSTISTLILFVSTNPALPPSRISEVQSVVSQALSQAQLLLNKIPSTSLVAAGATVGASVTLTATPTSVAPGQYSILSVSTTGIATCLISGGVYGTGQSSGIPTWSGWTGILSQTTNYAVTCTGTSGGSYATTTSVTVVQPPPVVSPTSSPATTAATTAPTTMATTLGVLTLTATPASAPSGSSPLLSLNAPSMTSCVISGGVYGTGQATNVPTWTGTAGVLTQSTTFTATCTTAAGASQTVTRVVPVLASPPAVLTVSAVPATVDMGGSVLISTSATNASSCVLSGGAYGTGQTVGVPSWTGTSGTINVDALFTLTCVGNDGISYTKNFTLVVNPSVTFISNPASTPVGWYTTLMLSSMKMASCLISGGIYGTAGQSTGVPSWSGWTGLITKDTIFNLACKGTNGLNYTKSVTAGTQVSTFVASSSTATLVTTTHRSEPNLFGGWGHHLGKLLRAPDNTLWVVDDTGMDVNINPELAYYHRVNNAWTLVSVLALPGRVQQNTGSLMYANGVIRTYGIDVDGRRIIECSYNTITGVKNCVPIVSLTLDAQANYIGAALTPEGKTLVWWTTVGGTTGGTFSHAYFDTSWHGPYTASVAPYTDVAYVHIAFLSPTRFALHAQGATGNAPNWKYVALATEIDLGQPSGTWQVLPGIGADTSKSSGDIWVDPLLGTHVFESTQGGNIAYVYKPKGGSYSAAPLFTMPSVFRARFIDGSDGFVYLVYGQQGNGLFYRKFQKSLITGAIPWSTIAPVKIMLPSQYTAQIDAIYPESRIYQTTPTRGINFGVNGTTRWSEILQVELAQ